MVEGTPPRDALLPAPQRATPACKGALCGAVTGSPRPHRLHPGHTGRGTLAARSRGRAAGGGTAPDTRQPSQWWKAPPPGKPFRHAHSEQRRPARAHALGLVLGPQARTDRTRDTQVAEPWLPAPGDGRPGEGQRLTPDAPSQWWQATPPGDGPRPNPRHAAPTGHAGQGDSVGPPHPHTRAHSTWVADPNSPPSGRAVGGGTAPDLRRPSQWWKAPPTGTPLRHAHSVQRLPARAHAVGPVLGPHARTYRSRDTQVAEPWLPAPEDARPGEGQRLTPDAPHSVGRPTPPGTAPHQPHGTQPPQGMQAKGTVLGPHTHTPAPTARGWRTPTARPVGRQSGKGQRLTSDAPHNGCQAPPPGTFFRHPNSEQSRPARDHTVGPVLSLHVRTDRTWNTRVAEPWLPAPEDGKPGEGQRLTPDAPHTVASHTCRGQPPHHSRCTQPPQGMQAKGTVLGPHTHTAAPTARGWRTPTARPVGRQLAEGQRLTSDAPHNGGRHPPRGRLFATPTASNACPQGRMLWGRCWVPTPAPTAPGTHGSRNPGCPLQRTGGWGRDSA